MKQEYEQGGWVEYCHSNPVERCWRFTPGEQYNTKEEKRGGNTLRTYFEEGMAHVNNELKEIGVKEEEEVKLFEIFRPQGNKSVNL